MKSLQELADEAFRDLLKQHFPVTYDQAGSIGRRYRRQDEVGTPFGITVDHQTMEDDTVTLRDRDTMTQVRMPVDRLVDELKARIAPAAAASPVAATGGA